MSRSNNWANPSQASPQEIAEMAAVLEARGRADDQLQVNLALMNALSLAPGDHVLEAGCGSGILCRSIAPQVTPGGKISGLDISPGILRIAKAHAASACLAEAIQWSSGRAEFLPYSNASFDIVLAVRLLLHVQDPTAVLKELARVVRPGGKIVAMDWDFETVTIDHSNRQLTRRLLNWRCDHYGGNNWSGRQLWKQMADTGLTNIQITPIVSVAYNEQDSLTLSLFRAAQVARDGGGITSVEYDTWIDELQSALKTRSFFASIVYFIVSGEK